MKSQKLVQQKQSEAPAALLSVSKPEELRWQMQEIELALARRAYELFEARGREHGHDWEDWFRAESELLRPVPVCMEDAPDRISVRANVLGFLENDLKVSIEPRRVSILGKKDVAEPVDAKPVDWYPDQILQTIELTAEVKPESAVVELETGQLKFELPKAEGKDKATVAAA